MFLLISIKKLSVATGSSVKDDGPGFGGEGGWKYIWDAM